MKHAIALPTAFLVLCGAIAAHLAGCQGPDGQDAGTAAGSTTGGQLISGRQPSGVQVSPAAAQKFAAVDFRQVVKPAMDKVFPAVVYIRCQREDMESGKKITTEVAGSGVILSAAGEVLTNWHVVDKAVKVRCLLSDGRGMTAKVVGTDKDTDLGLLQLAVPAGSGPLPCGVLGDSDLVKEGDLVLAMGAPWGLERTVTMGIISCTRRYLPETSEYSLWLQTDAAINPGNSGGPLVNTQGEVIGINTRAIVGGDTGFSVPARTVQQIVSQLRQYGRMNWSWTGLQLQPLYDFQKDMRFDANEGVIVSDTDEESPARHTDIRTRDRIVKINGRPVTAMTEEGLPAIRMEIGLLPKQKPVEIEIVRGTQTLPPITLTPREKGKVEGEELDCPRWDLTVKAINEFDNPGLFAHRKKGVFVYGVKHPGNAFNSRLFTQDIILKIDGKDIETLDDVKAAHKAALEGLPDKYRAIFTVLRNGEFRQVPMDFSHDYERE